MTPQVTRACPDAGAVGVKGGTRLFQQRYPLSEQRILVRVLINILIYSLQSDRDARRYRPPHLAP